MKTQAAKCCAGQGLGKAKQSPSTGSQKPGRVKERRIHNLQATDNKTRLFCVCVVV